MTDADTPQNAEPKRKLPEVTAQKSESFSKMFLATFLGALATGLAGVLLSAGFLNKIVGTIVPDKLPGGSVVFSTEQDCGGDGSIWRPMARGKGHFVVLADGSTFQANSTDDNGILSFNNVDLPQSPGGRAGITFVSGLARDKNPAPANLPSQNQRVPIVPSWIALTACERKPN